jgi:hypothetical protein
VRVNEEKEQFSCVWLLILLPSFNEQCSKFAAAVGWCSAAAAAPSAHSSHSSRGQTEGGLNCGNNEGSLVGEGEERKRWQQAEAEAEEREQQQRSSRRRHEHDEQDEGDLERGSRRRRKVICKTNPGNKQR